MINQASVRAVDGARFGPGFVRPLYGSYCFAHLPATVEALLTGGTPALPADVLGDLPQRYDTVILFFADAFGWRTWERFAQHDPFLRRVTENGVVSKSTSQFPSTTAAHVTTIHTGSPVGQSGVYEWFFYEPQIDAMIAPLLFSYAGDHERDRLVGVVRAEELFPTETIYDRLARHGIRSHVWMHTSYATSPYSTVVTHGATLMPFASLVEAVRTITQRAEREPGYYFLYYDRIDTAGHHHRPHSPEWDAEVTKFLGVMEQEFAAKSDGRLKRTLLLMAADHGQVRVDPATTVYVNERWPDVGSALLTNRQGRPLVAAGSSRDFFLHVKPDRLAAVHATLSTGLAGTAEVMRVQELIDAGIFGPPPLSRRFLDRVGNLVILPYASESVWWHEPGRFEQPWFGMHGGLTPEEMETPLLALAFD